MTQRFPGVEQTASPRGYTILSILAAACLCASPGLAFGQTDPKNELSEYFGFRPLEVFKLQKRSGNMLSADLNHDGLNDLVLIDNSNSRIDLLQQRKSRPEQAKAGPGDANSIENDWRFEHRKLSLDRVVSAMTAGDFNHDGRTDLAYLGAPDRLIIRLQPESGDWDDKRVFRLSELQPLQWTIASGDLNQDGRDDIAVLGKTETYILYQDDKGELRQPERLMNTSEKLIFAHISDVDGDGRGDLSYIAAEDSERTWCVRLQTEDHRLGPESRFDLDKVRGISFGNIDGGPADELLLIQAQTGRAKAFQWERPEVKPGELASQLIQYGFGAQAGNRDRDLAVGDINGDGLSDVVVTDPDSAQMIVFLQHKGAGLDQGTTYAGLVGGTQLRVADIEGDKSHEVVVLSPRERTIGISRMEGGRLTFPQPVPLEKEPVALEIADLSQDQRPEIVYVGKERTGGKTSYTLRAVQHAPPGVQPQWKAYPFGEQVEVSLSLRGDPERLISLDADGDGRLDFLVFEGLDRPPVFLKTNDKGVPVEVGGERGFGLGNVSAAGLFVGSLDGTAPAVLSAQNNFARNLKFNAAGHWQVVDQYNAVGTEAKIAGVAALDLDGQPGAEIVLVDIGSKRLRVLRKEDNIYRPWREVEIGAFPYRFTHVADLNGDGRQDLLLFGNGKFGVLYAGQTDARLKEVASYEPTSEKAFFADLVAGDLNHDGRMDLALVDTRSGKVEIVEYVSGPKLRKALGFQVFEAKSLSGTDENSNDPRESLIADVTGDGLDDLILLTHDRVLIYPQDDGKEEKSEKQAENK
jgi:hypothetical protein